MRLQPIFSCATLQVPTPTHTLLDASVCALSGGVLGGTSAHIHGELCPD
jgi:hypothetical protein